MKKYIVLLGLMFWLGQEGFSQDPQFSQFYAAPLYLGPSFTGSTHGTRIALNYRDQWPSMPGTFVTYLFSVDHYFHEYNSGLGLMVMRDDAGGGKLNRVNVNAQYSYDITLTNTLSLRPGIQFMYFTRNIDYSSLLFSDQMSLTGNNSTTVEIPSGERVQHFDFGTSMLLYHDDFWVGFSSDYLIKVSPALADNQNYLPIKYSVYAGYTIPLERAYYKRDQRNLYVATHFKAQGLYRQLDIGAYLYKDPLMFGLWYRGIPLFKEIRSHDALSTMLGYKINGISIGYSYDFTISRLITTTGGAHEVSIVYEFGEEPKKRMPKKRRTIPCPIF